MSQSTASALNNRVVSFDDFNCATCHQVADELVRCSGAFCSICMTTHLNKIERCVDKKSDIEA